MIIKKFILGVSLFFLISSLYSQELMKVKDVFDYDINDEFHYKGGISISAPPNGDRVKIIEKKYSKNNDTIFYKLRHDGYSSTPVLAGTPHLDYHFYINTTNLTITHLDSSLISFDKGFSKDTIFGQDYCNTLTNGYEYVLNPEFEGSIYRRSYGKGIGMISDYLFNAVGGPGPESTMVDETLIYYKKGTKECGTADVTSVANNLNDQMIVSVYPNPTDDVLVIKGLSLNDKVKIEIVDMKGTVVDLFYSEYKDEYIYITSKLTQGSYLIRVSSDDNLWCQKIFIKS